MTALLVAFALWIEVRPDPTVEHPFTIGPIEKGEVVTADGLEMRPVPRDVFEPVDPVGQIALRALPAGAPLTAADLGSIDQTVPQGWWVVPVDIPGPAAPGERVRLVIVDSGAVVEGVVAWVSDQDPYLEAPDGVAVADADAAQVAAAVSRSSLSVLVSTG
jgi:hypothetical protein